ncbi:sigma factor-like helix-turn-helix DNA-binding protein [Thermodesulfitimonas autotrophica]
MRYWRGWTTREIAQALDIPEGTVKSRLRRACVLIKPRLK